MKLFIKVLNENLEEKYKQKLNFATDCGFDLYQESMIIPKNARGFKIRFGISCAPDQVRGYYLYPRSSISNTKLRLANSVGIIDPNYRGEIIAKVDNLSDTDHELHENQSLFQLCAPDLSPLQVEFVTELSETDRGAGGFGSTH